MSQKIRPKKKLIDNTELIYNIIGTVWVKFAIFSKIICLQLNVIAFKELVYMYGYSTWALVLTDKFILKKSLVCMSFSLYYKFYKGKEHHLFYLYYQYLAQFLAHQICSGNVG